jgi:hypothetical protein
MFAPQRPRNWVGLTLRACLLVASLIGVFVAFPESDHLSDVLIALSAYWVAIGIASLAGAAWGATAQGRTEASRRSTLLTHREDRE